MLSDSAGTLISQGVGEGSVVNVTISAPVIVKKNVPGVPIVSPECVLSPGGIHCDLEASLAHFDHVSRGT